MCIFHKWITQKKDCCRKYQECQKCGKRRVEYPHDGGGVLSLSGLYSLYPDFVKKARQEFDPEWEKHQVIRG